MAAPKAIRDYMAALGSKGGQATGASKARSPDHYKRLADMRRAKAAARAQARHSA